MMFPRNHTGRISPADNPTATASQPAPGIQGGSTPSAAPAAAALTKAAAERILASYWQVNNTANESRSDTLLKTVEAGSSYSMDAGTYQMDRVTDPANRQYTAFTAENATYYIPRQPAAVYPRWFVVRVTYANLAAPQHATGAGYVLFTQAASRCGAGAIANVRERALYQHSFMRVNDSYRAGRMVQHRLGDRAEAHALDATAATAAHN